MDSDVTAWWQYPIQYLTLCKRNPRYRLYLLSHICQHIGDWYIRIASLLAVERLAPNSATAISILMLVKMGPHALLPAVGGALADSVDRRKLMMTLDLMGAFVTLGFLIAIQFNSLPVFYVTAALRATVHSLYEPATKALVPMIVGGHEDLKRAMTLNGLAWAFMLSIGGVIAGSTAATLGLEACFLFDSVTYVISAGVLMFLRGNYKVTAGNEDGNDGSSTLLTTDDPSAKIKDRSIRGLLVNIMIRPIGTFLRMTRAVWVYLWKSGFGLVVFLKTSGAIIWGPTDVLNAEYALVPGDEKQTSERLGIIFSCLGLGCLLGPVCANFITDPDRPATLQLVCVGSLAFMMSGWIGFSQTSTFSIVCIFTSLRAFGSSIIWVNSSLLLQTLTVPEMLGRVLAIEFASMMFFDGILAILTGILLDSGFTKNDVAAGVAAIAGAFFAVWSIYHMFGLGAARKQFNQPTPDVRTDKIARVVFA